MCYCQGEYIYSSLTAGNNARISKISQTSVKLIQQCALIVGVGNISTSRGATKHNAIVLNKLFGCTVDII